MANFLNVPVLSKVKIGSQVYYLKDAEVRALIGTLETNIAQNASDIAGLQTSKQDVVSFADGYNATTNKAATVKTVMDAIAEVTSFEFEVVQELPATGVKGVIYLKEHSESGVDMYEEFIWITNRYEKLGDTRIDLSNYYTKSQVDGLITTVEGKVTAEETRAKAAEEANADAITAEETRATGVEGGLNTRLGTAETKLSGIEAGAQVNVIEHVKVNGADLTITNKRVDLGSIPTAAELEALETRVETAEGDIDDLEENKEDKTNLKALAYKDSATAHVVSKTVSGVKASGTTTGELTGSLAYTSTAVTSSGTYTPEGDVELTGSAIASATLSSTPLTIKSMKTAGSVASFTEGAFTAATLNHTEASFAKEGLKAHVGVAANEEDAECLYFETATTANASLINGFTGGSKAADTFTANVLPTFEDKVAIANGAEVTTTAATLSAEFTGDAKAVSVSGNYDKANLGTVAFSGKAVELNVGDIVVPAQEATVD